MIHHIVLFSFDRYPDGVDKDTFLNEVKTSFEELPRLIDCLKGITVAINFNPDEEYDLLLHGTLTRKEDIQTYAKHPEHVLRVQKYIKPYVAKRACVDVELDD